MKIKKLLATVMAGVMMLSYSSFPGLKNDIFSVRNTVKAETEVTNEEINVADEYGSH